MKGAETARKIEAEVRKEIFTSYPTMRPSIYTEYPRRKESTDEVPANDDNKRSDETAAA